MVSQTVIIGGMRRNGKRLFTRVPIETRGFPAPRSERVQLGVNAVHNLHRIGGIQPFTGIALKRDASCGRDASDNLDTAVRHVVEQCELYNCIASSTSAWGAHGMTTSEEPSMYVPPREVPVPRSISSEAQAMLAMGMVGPESGWIGMDLDGQGWKKLIASREAAVMAMSGMGGEWTGAEVATEDLGGFVVFEITPDGVSSDDRRVYIDFHGGGFIQDGGPIACSRAVATAKDHAVQVWSVDL
jgi:hypothetical protein